MNDGDLISRNAMINMCKEVIAQEWNHKAAPVSWAHAYESFVDSLETAPTVDAVELPCKIGDTVWCIRNFSGHKHPQEGIVSEMLFTKEMKLQIVVKYVGCGHWGEKIFPTREAAEAAINKKEKENAAD